MKTHAVSGYIDDGYTEQAVIPARQGKWAELRLAFRSLSAGEQAEYALRAALADDAALPRLAAGLLAGKIVAWNLRDGRGRPARVTAGNLLRLNSALFAALAERVLGSADEADLKNCAAGCG